MVRRFRGESVHKVDAKGRVSIPAPFRRVLEEGDPDWTEGLNPNLVMIHGRVELRCLECYTIAGMEALDEMVSNLPRFDEDREYLELVLNSDSSYAQVDENGRIVLGLKLRELIGATTEVVFSGQGEKFQIWRPEAFAEHKAAVLRRRKEEAGRDPFGRLDAGRRTPRGGEE